MLALGRSSHSTHRDRSALSGVLVPVGNTSVHGDNSEVTVCEHQFQLVTQRGPSSDPRAAATAAAAVHAFTRTGGRLFATVVVGSTADGVQSNDRSLADESELSSSLHSSPAPRVHARQTSFQLYANAADNPSTASPVVRSSLRDFVQHGLSTLAPSLVGSSSPSPTAPQFVPFASSTASAAASGSEDPNAPVVRAMHVHPSEPVLALLVQDEIHFFDAASSLHDSSASSPTSAAAAAPLGSDRASTVFGSWVPRVLRHPLMADTHVIRFSGVGGGLVAAGTGGGLICLWQLLSVPSASAAANGATLAGTNSARRHGAWLFVLQDPNHARRPVDSLEFSPCGRWLVSASSESNTLLVWDVALALASCGENGSGSVGGSGCVPLSKRFGSVLEMHHGIDFVRFSPSGDALAVAASPRVAARSLLTRVSHALVQVGVRAAVTAWRRVTGVKEDGATADVVAEPKPVDDTTDATAAAAATKLPTGTLTIWDTRLWTHQTWQTSTPLSSVCWAPASPATGASPFVLLSLRGSHILQSLQLSSTVSALAHAAIRVNLESLDGIPTTREPSDPSSMIDRFRIGGAVRQAVWSARAHRLAVVFEEEQEGSELVALFAVRAEDTETHMVLPVGMIRGPPCPCRGRKHTIAPQVDEDALEHKYDDDVPHTAAAASSARVYPSLSPLSPRTCRARNTPSHLSFLPRARLTCGGPSEVLVIAWKYGQVSFVPMYFDDKQ